MWFIYFTIALNIAVAVAIAFLATKPIFFNNTSITAQIGCILVYLFAGIIPGFIAFSLMTGVPFKSKKEIITTVLFIALAALIKVIPIHWYIML